MLLFSLQELTSLLFIKMETKSQSSNSHEDNTTPSSATLKYLKEKIVHTGPRKSSIQSTLDRPNFCFNLTSTDYSVMRVYIDALASKQIRLYYTKFTPKIKTGQICIIHGYGESTQDYLSMAEYFAKRGYVINMIDLRGFGYSGGERVNQPTVRVMSDIETLLRTCCERDLSTFIIAHGLGAMFLNALLQQNSDLPISGVINITPLVNFVNTNRSSSFQRILLKISPMFFSQLLVHNMVNPTALTKNPMAIKSIIDSNFWEFFITLRMADEYQHLGQKVRSEGYKFTYPTLFCCGGMDLLQDLKQLKNYYNSLSSQDKHMIVFREGYHQLQNDYQADELLLRIYDWIESRKNKTKWKQTKPFQKTTILKGNKFWVKILFVIGFLISSLLLIRKIRSCFIRLGKF